MISRRIRAFLSLVAAGAIALGVGVGVGVGGAQAQEAVPFDQVKTLGVGRMYNNDLLGDQHDRWQTMSYFLSVIRGRDWTGAAPTKPFDLMEYRFGLAIITPSNLKRQKDDDRRYVGRYDISARTHVTLAGQTEGTFGLGVVATGPATGVGDLNDWIHRVISASRPYVREYQIGDAIHPFATAEAGRTLDFGLVGVRPFVEARAGDETLARAGVDLELFGREKGALWLRDSITGQRYVGVAGEDGGRTAFVLGGDVAHVFDSVYLPSGGVEASPTRSRLRAGVSFEAGAIGVFYGLTWLSKEFESQPEGQVLGSLRFRMAF